MKDDAFTADRLGPSNLLRRSGAHVILRAILALLLVAVSIVQPAVAVAGPPSQVAEPPPPLPVREFQLPDIHEARLANGLRIAVASRHDIPVVTMRMLLPGGGGAEPSDKTGLASIATDLLTNGTTTRTSEEIAGTIEQLGGLLQTSASDDAIDIFASVLSEDVDVALDLLADVVLNPVFPESWFGTSRDYLLFLLDQSLRRGDYVADRALGALIYGDHPYGRPTTVQSLRSITRNDVVSYYRSQRNPVGAVLVIVGDVTPEAILPQVELAFGNWSSTASPNAPRYPAPPARTGRQIYLVDRPGSSQAEIRIGRLTTSGVQPDRFALRVANTVLGAGTTSRLYRNLRETNGYTYAAFSGFTTPHDVGYFVAATAVRTEVAQPAIQEMLAEIERLARVPVPTAELVAAQSYVIGNMALSLETNDSLASRIAYTILAGLPVDTIDSYPRSIAAVDAPAVQSAAARYLRPDDLVIVVVGDAAVLADPLTRIAPVSRIDADGQALR